MLTFDEVQSALLQIESPILERAILFAENIALFTADNCENFALEIANKIIFDDRNAIIADIIELFETISENLDDDGQKKLIGIFLQIGKTCAKTIANLLPPNDNTLQCISLRKRCQGLIKIAEDSTNNGHDKIKHETQQFYFSSLKDIIAIYTHYLNRISQTQAEQNPPLQAHQHNPKLISLKKPALSGSDVREDLKKPSTRGTPSKLGQTSYTLTRTSNSLKVVDKTPTAGIESNRISESSLEESTYTSNVLSQTILSLALPVEIRACFFIENLNTFTQANLINLCEEFWQTLLYHNDKQECINDIIELLNNVILQINSIGTIEKRDFMSDDFRLKLRIFVRIIAGKILREIQSHSKSTSPISELCRNLQLSPSLENDIYYLQPEKLIHELNTILQMFCNESIELRAATNSQSSIERSLYIEIPDSETQGHRSVALATHTSESIVHLSNHASPSTYLEYKSPSKQKIPGFHQIPALADGNCGFNAIVIFVCKKIMSDDLPLESYTEFYKLTCLTLNIALSEASLKTFLNDKTNHEKQQILSLILRELSVSQINDHYGEYKLQFEQQLLACFDSFIMTMAELFSLIKDLPYFQEIFRSIYDNPTTINKDKIESLFVALSIKPENLEHPIEPYMEKFELFIALTTQFQHLVQDYPFLIHRHIRDQFKGLFISYYDDRVAQNDELIAWWNQEGKNEFFAKFSSSAELTMQESRWADYYLLDALAHRLKITLILHNLNEGNVENRETQYVYGIGGGLIEINDENQSLLNTLKQYGFGDYVHGYFQLKLFSSAELFYAELEKIPVEQKALAEMTLAIVDNLIALAHQTQQKQTQFPLIFPDNLPHQDSFTRETIIAILLSLGIIQKDTANGYRFISDEIDLQDESGITQKLTIPDRKRISQKLSGIDDLSRALVMEIFEDNQNTPVCHILRSGNHFDYLEPAANESSMNAENPHRLELSRGLPLPHLPGSSSFDDLHSLLGEEKSSLLDSPVQTPSGNPIPLLDEDSFSLDSPSTSFGS